MDTESARSQQVGTWFVRIDRWQPTPLNRLLCNHWAVAARKKRHDCDIVALACLGAGVPRAEVKRLVCLEITLGPRQRACDPDAYWKSLLDALVKCGALVNDSHVWLELGPVTFHRGPIPGTVIKIENLCAPKPTKIIYRADTGRTEKLTIEDHAQAKRVFRFLPS